MSPMKVCRYVFCVKTQVSDQAKMRFLGLILCYLTITIDHSGLYNSNIINALIFEGYFITILLM